MGLVWDRVGLVVYFTPSPSCRDSNDESILALAFAFLPYMSWCSDDTLGWAVIDAFASDHVTFEPPHHR
jgi:hypothetical protein